MSTWASPWHFRVHDAYRAGLKLRVEVSREDDQHWEWVSNTAQSEAQADARRSKGALEQDSSAREVFPGDGCSKREWGQFGPSFDMPASVAAKEEGLGHERIQPEAPAAGNRSKEEWEQPSSTLVGPGNVEVKNEGSRKKRLDKQREDEQKWEWVIPKKEAAQSAGSGDARPNQDAAESASSGSLRPDKVKWQRASPKNKMEDNMFSNDSRSVPSKGSVLPQRCTTKRSVADQTVDSVEQEDSLWDWLTTATTATVATQTLAPEALQQWCSIQHKYWMELQGSSVAHSGRAPKQRSWSNFGTESRLSLST